MDNFELILKNEFLDEAAQSLADAEQCFLMLENDPNNIDNLNKIFRLAHNLKGSSKAVGFEEMSHFTHEFESFILKLKNGELQFNTDIISLMFACNDHLIQMVNQLKENHEASVDSSELIEKIIYFKSAPQNDAEIQEHVEEIEEVTEEQNQVIAQAEILTESIQEAPTLVEPVAEKNETAQDLPLDIEPNLDLLNELLGITAKLSTPSSTQEPEAVPKAEVVMKPAIAETHSKPEPVVTTVQTKKSEIQETEKNKSTAPAVDESIRISVSKLENLLNYVGEMVILQSVLREQFQTTESLLARKTIQQLGKVGKEIQDISMSLRMVPIKPTFQKMQRIVRDTALAVKKDVSIKLFGEDTELDKTVLEKISDPLVHLIRNSVDHGIESAEARLAAGKPAKGEVILSAAQKSGKLVIEVKDDGAGLNPEKLKQKAIEKGILKPGVSLAEKDAFNLIFAPGFSTKEQVTDVSGRGVGMDVVKTNIHDLSGEIQIFSELGKGTTFQITLPLSLAIIDGMVVTFAKDKFIVPLNQVHESMRPNQAQIQFNQGLGNVLMLRGENLPLFRVGDFFNQTSTLETTDMIALIIRTGEKPFALLVDDILGQYQVVIKKLGPEFSGMKGIAGSTILGDGKPALILEPNELIKRSRTSLGPKASATKGEKVA